jgi:hypothetical protein
MLGVKVHTCNATTLDVKARSRLEVSLGCIVSSSQKEKTKKLTSIRGIPNHKHKKCKLKQ